MASPTYQRVIDLVSRTLDRVSATALSKLAPVSLAEPAALVPEMGGRPSILMVDDIQWADDASAQVFHYLARHACARPVLVSYAYRDEDAGSDERLARLVESLCRVSDARRVPLTRLDAADTDRLVAVLAGANLGAPGLAERLHRETEGNPFFLTSILHSPSEGETPLEPPMSSAPDGSRMRCVPPYACDSRTCPRRSARRSKPPRSSAGASTSTPFST